jgi:hypothetical protein
MARVRATAKPAPRRRAVNVETMRSAGDGFLSRFGILLDEVVSLREAFAAAQAENLQLRAELAEGIELFRSVRALVVQAEAPARTRRSGARRTEPAASTGTARRTRTRAGAARTRGRAQAARTSTNGRATPAAVTGDVVRAVIGKLGSATAGEIAAQISAAGTPVSGRAIRHIAKGAGAVMRPGDDGRMVYSLK